MSLERHAKAFADSAEDCRKIVHTRIALFRKHPVQALARTVGFRRQFLEADTVSAQELRSRSTVREIVGQMVRDARRRGSDELKDLAVRIGIDPLDPDLTGS